MTAYADRPNCRELDSARAEFAQLLSRKALEREFQSLFARCPFLLSESLPLRLEPTDIIPLGRPGKSEPDFVFYPDFESTPSFYGVIELKRPSSRILTRPRSDAVILTRDAQTAVTQTENYAARLGRQLIERADHAMFLGNARYTFVIMGLTDELTDGTAHSIFRLQEDGQLPPTCQIIPYDELLRRFDQAHTGRVMILFVDRAEDLSELVNEIYHSLSNSQGRLDLTDENFSYWHNLENSWAKANGDIQSKRRFDRTDFCVMGTESLATETPNPSMFRELIWAFATAVSQAADAKGIAPHLGRRLRARERVGSFPLNDMKDVLTKFEYRVLRDAVERCRSTGQLWTWLDTWSDKEAVQFLEDVGWVTFMNADSGETYYSIREDLVRHWNL